MKKRTELKEAQTSFLLGILSILSAIFILPGIILGIIGYKKSKKIFSLLKKENDTNNFAYRKAQKSKLLNIVGIILSLFFFFIIVSKEKGNNKVNDNITPNIETTDSTKTTISQIPFCEANKTAYDINGNKTSAKTTYEIIEETANGNEKYVYEIRLSNNKLTKVELESLAKVLKNRLDKDYDRIFISYYLPNMKVGSGAWATSHFDKDLKVNILGRTYDYEQNNQNDCAEKLQVLSFVKDRIIEDMEMIEDYYNNSSQEKFNNLIEGLIDVVVQSNKKEKQDIEWAEKCCPDAKVY